MSQTKIIETREALIESAIAEFVEHGFGGASVRKICARAGASANAITYHFGSKDALYAHVLSQFAELQVGQAEAALAGEARSAEEFGLRLEMFLVQMLETYFAHRDVVLIVLREFEQRAGDKNDPVFQRLAGISTPVREYFERGKEAGFVRADVDCAIAAGTLIDRLLNQARFAHTHTRFYGETTLDADYRQHWVRASLGLILNGVRP